MATLKVDVIAKAKGINMSTLQLDSRLNMSIISRYWHNKVRAVDLDVLGKIAKALDVSVTDLIEEKAEETEAGAEQADKR